MNKQTLDKLVSQINNLEDRIKELESHERGFAGVQTRVSNSANISISDSTTTALTFNTDDFDTDDLHDTSTNKDRITIKQAGKYLIVGQVVWESNSTGYRYTEIYKNGLTVLAGVDQDAVSTVGTYQNISTIADLSIDDYITLRTYQNSGGNLNVLTLEGSPIFSVALLP